MTSTLGLGHFLIQSSLHELLRARIRIIDTLESIEIKKFFKENQSCSPIPPPWRNAWRQELYLLPAQALRGCVYMVLWDGHKQKPKEN